jgi:hypothetical protein
MQSAEVRLFWQIAISGQRRIQEHVHFECTPSARLDGATPTAHGFKNLL